MQLQDRYDWIVLGDHPGALLTACAMARAKFSTLVIPMTYSALMKVSAKGQVLDPESNFTLGLGRADQSVGLLSEFLIKMGVLAPTSRLVRYGTPIMPQVLTPKLKILLSNDSDVLRTEMEREFGEKRLHEIGLSKALDFAESISLEFWRTFPERFQKTERKDRSIRALSRDGTVSELRTYLNRQSFGSNRTQKEWFSLRKDPKPLDGSEDWKEYCEGAWYGVVGAEERFSRNVDFIHALALARTGAAFRGGLTAYRQFLLRWAQRFGAHVAEQSTPQSLFVENGKLVGVQLNQGGKMIGVGAAIVGSSLAHLQPQVHFSGRRWGKSVKRSPKPSGWKFTLALTVHNEAIPPGMQSRAVWKENGAPPLEIEVADQEDYENLNPEHRLVFVRTRVPFTSESLEVEYQRKLSARMFKQLTHIFPFLEYHVVQIYPDFRDRLLVSEAAGAKGKVETKTILDNEDEFSDAYGFASLEKIPENLREYEETGIGCLSGVEGLYVATGESYPMLGSFGSTVSAVEAIAHFILSRDRENGMKKYGELWGSPI